MDIKGIDVSSWQGFSEWGKIKKDGIRYAMLRITQRHGIDSSFEHNFSGCKAHGIRVGVYKYSYALSTTEIKKEAQEVIDTLAGRGIDFPVWLDLEWNEQRKLSSATLSAMIKAFEKIIVNAGYKFGIYCNMDWYDNVIPSDCKGYDFWLARYPSKDDGTLQERLRPSVGVGWQYSSKGKVNGVNGNTDMNVFYTDYSSEKDTVADVPEGATQPMISKIEKATQIMEAWAADNSHGYDQIYRWGEKGDYDCSSAIIQACENAGIPVKSNGATYTGNMRSVFLRTGFKDVTSSVNLRTGAGLIRGDVLLNNRHHTAMYVGNGKEVEASINEKGTATGGRPGDQMGREFLVRSYRNYPWDCVLRYTDKTPTEAPEGMFTDGSNNLVQQAQIHLNNYTGAKLVVDGEVGTKTKNAFRKALQTAMNLDMNAGLEVDGIIGTMSKTWLKKVLLRKGSVGQLVTVLQIGLLMHGIDPNGVENPGQFGSGCNVAVGAFQKNKGLEIDFIAGYNTFMKMQE